MVKTLTRTAILAGLVMTGGLALAQDTPAGVRANPVYCTGCLCEDTPPQMTTPGRWVRSGTMGARITLRWQPSDPPHGQVAMGCRPPARG
ncbi:hypothetical protein E8L99_22245 [Phreatobacter aquaticus]|uniref:Uncharacterized protein n=1 Tax=Phreatobacter aquaticus TaxID=2570229 RepID=A0A4D7QRS5_9HYPH|nr:hypothetical protein [Phreatobacter aquaticus]QCK88286.1 hypothetical protein E8L99_22245 [Phreatobacter aquaticus]